MSNPQSYTSEQYKNFLCAYIGALNNSAPPSLKPQLHQAIQEFCQLPADSDSDSDSETDAYWIANRIPLTIPQVKDVLGDPWFAWDMGGTCNILESIAVDIFGENFTLLDPKIINPVIDSATPNLSSEQIGFLKAVGTFHHYMFARTYYIDRCYGTTAYLSYYFNNSIEDFQNAHIEDFQTYVDGTGMIKGDVLLQAWQDDGGFRSSLNILQFIKPLIGVFCSDFWNWSSPNIYWWTQDALVTSPWEDNLTIQDSWYNGSGQTISVGDSKIVTPLGDAPFPAYRVSVSDLYSSITLPESDTLAFIFGTNVIKGPSLIQNLPQTQYSENCYIPPPEDSDSDSDSNALSSDSETPTPTPTETPTPTPTETPTPTPTEPDPYDPYDPYAP